jgi:molybdate transport system substrate-binding protein
VVSNEDDVKGVVQKVALGEADAGIVYRTDVTASVAEDLDAIDVSDDVNVVAVYPIAALAGASEHARGFVEYVLGPGQDTLRAAGFLPP